jgi:Mg/Co/Ni transporter MgtE
LNESSIRNDSGLEAANRSLILQEKSDDATKLDPLDIEDISSDEQMLTPDLVAEELRSLNSTQVANYPLHELSSDDILAAFNLLSDTDIQKVLGNTKPDNLQIIFSKLPGLLHESIFSRLDESTRSYVVNSIGRGVIPP